MYDNDSTKDGGKTEKWPVHDDIIEGKLQVEYAS